MSRQSGVILGVVVCVVASEKWGRFREGSRAAWLGLLIFE